MDLAVRPTDDRWTVPRSPADLCRLHGRVRQPTRIMLEAAGGYERVVEADLPGLPAVVVNLCQLRDFARAYGVLAKTDRVDARLLARFAAEVRPAAQRKLSKAVQEPRALVSERCQLVELLFIILAVLLVAATSSACGETGDAPIPCEAPTGVPTKDSESHFAGVCSGRNEYDRATLPKGPLVAVGAVRRHTCGLKTHGTIACWGDDSHHRG